MRLPDSSQLNTAALARLFDNKSESYKLFWFKAILHEAGQGKSEIGFRTLIERMIADAWYMVSEYKLNLGPSDTLEKAVLYIQENTEFLPTEKEETLLAYLKETDDRQVKEYMRTLSLNVPYRLQAPLMENAPDSKLWYKLGPVTDYINAQTGMIYEIERDGNLDSRIVISPEWMEYITQNLGILLGWTDYNLIIYLQRRNPTVPGIASKIYPPQERKLTVVSRYWKYMIGRGEFYDIYSGGRLDEKDISIDHFVPWSYVASDELWNLVPTARTVNSSKGSNLPRWDAYFGRLAEAEYQAYRIVQDDEGARKLFERCARENLNSDEVRFRLYREGLSKEVFTGQLEEILLPVYESAKNMGFREWVYEK